jgi:23S rRNA (adenine2503-C2)-methyltransferase
LSEAVSPDGADPAPQPPAPRAQRLRPPRHLADLDPAERERWAEELSLPPMRVRQVARHYFARLTQTASAMTDLPAEGREELVAELLPELVREESRQTADGVLGQIGRAHV